MYSTTNSAPTKGNVQKFANADQTGNGAKTKRVISVIDMIAKKSVHAAVTDLV